MANIPRILLLIDQSRHSSRQFLAGVARYAADHGPWECFLEPLSYRRPRGEQRAWFQAQQADGIIARDVADWPAVEAMRLPVVVSSSLAEGVGTPHRVVTDAEAIAAQAADHLLGCGFRQFAYCGFQGLDWSRARQQAFVGRLGRQGCPVIVYGGDPDHEGDWATEKPRLIDWLTALPKPVGIMAANDDRGRQLIEAARLAGVAVPEDVAVVGVDDDELVCTLCWPRLSSVALNFARAGYEAAARLDMLIRHAAPSNDPIIVSPVDVVARHSTDSLALTDRQVAQAVRYIRHHAHGPISVADVAAAATLARRTLEKRFRAALHRSVHAEINRVRMAHVATLLRETNLGVSQIAGRLPFTDSEHIGRDFRRAYGLSPLAYRKHHSVPG